MTISEAFGFLPGWVASNGAYKAEGPSMLGSSGFIPDNYEVIVSTDSLCSSSDNEGGCSVVTPGAIAHRMSSPHQQYEKLMQDNRWLGRRSSCPC